MKRRILLVEDGPRFDPLIRRIAPSSEIRQAISASSALALACAWLPDLFIIDLELPDMRGAELADLIRRDDALGHIPVLYVSSFVELPEISSERTVLNGNLAFGMPSCMPTLRQHVARHLIDRQHQAILPQDVVLEG